MSRVVTRFAALMGAALLASGCPKSPPPQAKAEHRVRVRSFTEATAVRELVTVAPYAFVATASGLDRWDLRSGSRVRLATEHGLPSDAVVALDYDPERRWLWVATDEGLTRYELDSASFVDLPAPAEELGVEGFGGATLAAAADGGLWIGLPAGLFHADGDGNWRPTEVTAPVTDLFVAGAERVWVGTSVGLFETRPGGTARRMGVEQGCELAAVRFIESGPDGAPVIVGDNAEGQQRVVLESEEKAGCVTYRASPSHRWVAAAPTAGALVILTERGLFAMRRPEAFEPRRLFREGMRLVRLAPEGGRRGLHGPYVLTPVAGQVPDGAQEVAATGGGILVGTRNLGTAFVVPEGRFGQTRWLRRRELARDATTLSVACRGRDDCYVSTGSHRLWHFDGQRFTDVAGGERAVLSVVGAGERGIYGLRGRAEGAGIEIARLEEGAFVDPPELVVETPGERSQLSFARLSPAGVLWLGLAYQDEDGAHPYGVALVDLDLGTVAYHRDGDDLSEAPEAEGLAIPRGALDVSFAPGNATWLATGKGAARLRGGEGVELVGAPEGLESERLHAIACAPGGAVYAASERGVGVFEKGSWSHPKMFGHSVHDLELGADGRLWMATERGLAVYDGRRVRRLDARRGLIEDHIENVTLDRFARVWIRGDQGIGLITP